MFDSGGSTPDFRAVPARSLLSPWRTVGNRRNVVAPAIVKRPCQQQPPDGIGGSTESTRESVACD